MTEGLLCARAGLSLSFSSQSDPESRYFPASLLPGQSIRGLERGRQILKGRQGAVGLGSVPEAVWVCCSRSCSFHQATGTDSAPRQPPAVLSQGPGSPSRSSRPRAPSADAGAQAPTLPREGPLQVLGARGCQTANPRQILSQRQEALRTRGGSSRLWKYRVSQAADERARQASWHRLAAATPGIANNTGHKGVLSPQQAVPGPSTRRLSERRDIR